MKFSPRFLRWLPLAILGLVDVLFFSASSAAPRGARPDSPRRGGRVGEASEFPIEPIERSSSALRYRACPGRVVCYDADFAQEVFLQVESPVAGGSTPQEVKTRIQGRMEWVSYSWDDPHRLLMGLRFVDPSLRLSTSAGELPRDEESFAQEFFVLMDDRGEYERFYFPPTMKEAVRDLAKGWILHTRILLPESPVEKWETREADLSGRFSAQYRAGRHRSGRTEIRKEKGRYEELFAHMPEGGTRPDLRIAPAGEFACLFDAEAGYPHSLDMEETLTLNASGLLKEGRISFRGSLRFLRESIDPGRASTADLKRKLASYSSSLSVEPEGSVPSGPRIGETVQELLAILAEFARTDRMDEKDAFAAVERLGALLAFDETKVQEILALLRSGRIDSRVAALLPGALGCAGTPSAQRALVSLLEDTAMDGEVRTASLISLGSCAVPTQDTEKALRRLALQREESEFALNALLTLGSHSSRVAGFDENRSADLIGFILEQEVSLQSQGNTLYFLEALGNAANPKAYPAVERYLEDSDEEVRATAIYALRHLDRPEVSSHLARALEDPNDRIRRKALEAISDRPNRDEFGAAILRISREDPDEGIRALAAALCP